MAGLYGSFTTGAVALNSGTAQTVLQITAPTNQRLRITEYEFSFDGTNSANTPASIKIERQTGGTFTNNSVAPVKINDPSNVGETLQATSNNTVTVEPTEGDKLRYISVPVFGGTVILPQPPGQEDYVMGGTKLGIKISAAQAVNVYVTVRYEE
jgi:hypothetical protein